MTLKVHSAGDGKENTMHVHTACGGKGYTQHAHTAGVERELPCTSTMLAVKGRHPGSPYCWRWKEGTTCTSILMGVERMHPGRRYCKQWNGKHPAHPSCWVRGKAPFMSKTAGSGKRYTQKVHRQLLLMLFLLCDAEKCREKVILALAFLQAVNCPSLAAAFPHPGQSSTASHILVRHCPAMQIAKSLLYYFFMNCISLNCVYERSKNLMIF